MLGMHDWKHEYKTVLKSFGCLFCVINKLWNIINKNCTVFDKNWTTVMLMLFFIKQTFDLHYI